MVEDWKPLVASFALLVVACGGSGTPAPTPSSGSGTLTATINGEAWTSEAPPLAGATLFPISSTSSSELLTIAGTNRSGRYQHLSIGLAPAAVGSYTVLLPSGGNSGYAHSVQVSSSAGEVWIAGLNGPDGQVVVTSLTSTRVTGTFQFTASGPTGNALRVTSGRFDLPVTRIAR